MIINTLHNLKSNYLSDLHNDELFQYCVKHHDNLSSELDWLTRIIALDQSNESMVRVFKPENLSISVLIYCGKVLLQKRNVLKTDYISLNLNLKKNKIIKSDYAFRQLLFRKNKCWATEGDDFFYDSKR